MIPGHGADFEALVYGKHPGLQQFPCLRPGNGCAKHFAAPADNDLDDALGLAFRLGAVVLGKAPARHLDIVAMAFTCLRLGKADMCDFGIGVR